MKRDVALIVLGRLLLAGENVLVLHSSSVSDFDDSYLAEFRGPDYHGRGLLWTCNSENLFDTLRDWEPSVIATDNGEDIRFYRFGDGAPRSKYHGFSYPGFLARWPFRALWRRFMCPRDYHLLDESRSGATDDEMERGMYDHYLSCDVCGIAVQVLGIQECYQDFDITLHRRTLKQRRS